jgi:hypothetical protein
MSQQQQQKQAEVERERELFLENFGNVTLNKV